MHDSISVKPETAKRVREEKKKLCPGMTLDGFINELLDSYKKGKR